MENLRKCIGKRIGEVSSHQKLKKVPKLFDGIQVDGFQFTFEEFSDDAL